MAAVRKQLQLNLKLVCMLPRLEHLHLVIAGWCKTWLLCRRGLAIVGGRAATHLYRRLISPTSRKAAQVSGVERVHFLQLHSWLFQGVNGDSQSCSVTQQGLLTSLIAKLANGPGLQAAARQLIC